MKKYIFSLLISTSAITLFSQAFAGSGNVSSTSGIQISNEIEIFDISEKN